MPEPDPPAPMFRPPAGALPPEDPEFPGWEVGETPLETVQRKQRRVWLWVCVALCIGLGAFLGARPAYNQLKLWRSRPLAEASLKLSTEGKTDEATQKAQTAYRLAPGDPLATRALATAAVGVGQLDQAGVLWEQLTASGRATRDDREALVRIYTQTGRPAAAQEHLDKLVALFGEDAPLLLLSAGLKAAQGDSAGARQAVERAAQLAPENDLARASLAAVKLQSAATAKEGEAELAALGAKKTSTGLRALTVLATSPALSIQAYESVAVALDAHPLATASHRLKALELRWMARPAEREALLDEALARYGQPGTDPRVQTEFAGLLLKLQSPDRVLKLLPLEQALTRGDWITLYLDALSAQRRWEEGLGVLENVPMPLPSPVVELYRSRCHEELGNTAKAQEYWQRALSLAKSHPEHLLYLARYAERRGKIESARDAYRTMLQLPAAAPFAERQLARLDSR